jgi:hypothetical protein
MAAETLVGTAVAGGSLLVVVLWMARGVDWRSNDIFAPAEGGTLVASLAGSPLVWTLGFLVAALGVPMVALAATGVLSVSVPGGVTTAGAAFGLLVFLFLVGGTYAAVRDRQVSAAGATLAAALVVGTLLLVAVAGTLLMG